MTVKLNYLMKKINWTLLTLKNLYNLTFFSQSSRHKKVLALKERKAQCGQALPLTVPETNVFDQLMDGEFLILRKNKDAYNISFTT